MLYTVAAAVCLEQREREKKNCNLARIRGGRRVKRIGRILHVRVQLARREGGHGGPQPAGSVCIFHFATAAHTHTNMRSH